jgi:ubiquitin carboxyl-terminal hydrolase MINDY-3/4
MAGMQVFTAKSVEQTKSFIGHHVRQFMSPKGNGLVLLVLSVLMSKRVDSIRPEMDSVEGAFGGGGKLIGGHDYCTQEIVNLLLCGVASSNVFDGKQLLEGTSEDDPKAVVLKGIPARSDLGFLSLFEAYEYIVVGNHLKRPRFNVWVVCSESHYSVLFADPRLLLNQDIHEKMAKLDMFYFDGLGNQDEEIRLTVHASALSERSKPKPDDLVPPLNLVLQTKWPLARIDWNGVDPLL